MADVEFKQPILPDEKKQEEAGDEEQPKEEGPLQLSIREPLLSYDPPVWACRPPDDLVYKLEIIKNGTVIDTVSMSNRKHDSFFVIGRLPSCDLTLEHPSLSRHHCILQYGVDTMNRTGKGWHLYDMESTHGTKANRQKMPPKQYIRMHIGWVLSFGLSTRSITLTGPEDEKEKEWDVSPTEMIEIMRRKELEKKLTAKAKEEFDKRKKEEEKDEGIDWGMGFDFETGDTGLVHIEGNDAHLMEDHEAYYRDDPKKALAKFFDREGFDMEFVFSESGVNSHNHKWICSIELPIDTGSGRAVHASATVSTSKKDGQFQCALEACRILDSHGVLRKSTARSKLKKKTLEEEDYYEEDEDEYLDRTGQVGIQRERRKNRAEGIKDSNSKTHTYESILADLEESKKEIEELNTKYERLNSSSNVVFDEENSQVKETASKHEDLTTKTEKSKVRQRITELTHQVQRLEQLAKIAKPIPLPEINLKTPSSTASASDKQAFFRKLRQLGKQKKTDETNDAGKAAEPISMPQISSKQFVAEVEEEENEKESLKATTSNVPMAKPEPTKEVKPIPSISKAEKLETVEIHNEPRVEQIVQKTPVPEVKEPQLSQLEESMQEDESLLREKRRQRNQKPRKRKMEDSSDYGEGMENKEDQYATWLPPTDQAGDGSTQLNTKFEGRY